jgi:hypothetical protein
MSVKEKAKKRDGGCCIKCGKEPSDSSNLHAHHIVPSSKGGKDRVENLATLCARCHKFAPDYDTVVVSDGMYQEAFQIYKGTMTSPLVDIASFGAEINEQYNMNIRKAAISGIMMNKEPLPNISESNWWAIMAALCNYDGFRDVSRDTIYDRLRSAGVL